ncbi:uncharacterized protein AAG666_014500 isoform 1-T2 [Megaptera novaeangliae]
MTGDPWSFSSLRLVLTDQQFVNYSSAFYTPGLVPYRGFCPRASDPICLQGSLGMSWKTRKVDALSAVLTNATHSTSTQPVGQARPQSLSSTSGLPKLCWIKKVTEDILALFLILEEMPSAFHHCE